MAGLVRGCDLRTDALDADSARELERLVAASGLAAAHAEKPWHATSPADRDLTHYEIEIASTAGRHRANLTDRDLDGPAGPLIVFLQKHARPMTL